MRFLRAIPGLLLPGLLVLASPAAAQEGDSEMAAMMEAWEKAGTPGDAHGQLAAFAGEWDATVKMWMDPSGEPTVTKGKVTSRMVMDGRFLEEKIDSQFMGRPFQGVAFLGYDNVDGKCKAVWMDNMSTAIYHYTGTVSDGGKRVELMGEHTDPATGERVKSRSVRKLVSKDEMVETGYEIRNGVERKSMEITFRRRK